MMGFNWLRGLQARGVALACVCVLAAAPVAVAAGPDDWVLSYEGKSSNAFIWDKRAKELVKKTVPAKMSKDLLDALGGPPDPIFVVDHRYVSASACVAHACMMKGMYWIDTASGSGLGAYLLDDVLTVGSIRLASAAIPAAARDAVRGWLAENDAHPTSVQFVSATGQASALNPELFMPAAVFSASPAGPSFDCGKARTAVEKAICGNAALAKQDLELAALVKEIRQGHDTVRARDELRAMQRAWLKTRDAACSDKSGIAACLAEQYRQQHERLMHWTPAQ